MINLNEKFQTFSDNRWTKNNYKATNNYNVIKSDYIVLLNEITGHAVYIEEHQLVFINYDLIVENLWYANRICINFKKK